MIVTSGFLRVGAFFFSFRPLRDGGHFLLLAGGVEDLSDSMLSSDWESSEPDMSDSDSSAIILYH